ncbi:DinB family protein [Algibacter aquimarinus]|uniref:DinB family protein n=1 Tax=Algibacter aquimarinus TaxID=1136748 RepID=A0ABP9HQ65_9FLAO
MKVSDLNASEYNNYYQTYISKVSNTASLVESYKEAQNQVTSFFKAIPDNKLEFKYAPGKWTIKEVFQHIIDTERVFMYRCFRIARHDKTPLSGFEQDDYIVPSKSNFKTMDMLVEEYQTVRQSSIVLLKSLNHEDLKFIGNASGSNVSARAAAFIILGHEIHHIDVIKNKYL